MKQIHKNHSQFYYLRTWHGIASAMVNQCDETILRLESCDHNVYVKTDGSISLIGKMLSSEGQTNMFAWCICAVVWTWVTFADVSLNDVKRQKDENHCLKSKFFHEIFQCLEYLDDWWALSAHDTFVQCMLFCRAIIIPRFVVFNRSPFMPSNSFYSRAAILSQPTNEWVATTSEAYRIDSQCLIRDRHYLLINHPIYQIIYLIMSGHGTIHAMK